MAIQTEQKNSRKCRIFYCDRRGDRYCCFYCDKKNRCKNHCLNYPKRCGQIFEEGKINGKMPNVWNRG